MPTQIDRKKLKKTATAQGFEIEDAKSGFFVCFPSGERVLWHYTPSDGRADKNAMALMKRQGFIWPFDKKAQKAQARKQEGP